MAQAAVAGPLAEADLGDQLRRRPVHAAGLRPARRVGERRLALLERVQPLAQSRQGAVVEAAADAAGVAQRALLVVHAHEEGAEPRARSGRLCEAADDELLAVRALALEPGPGAPARVLVAGALGHHALELLQARLLVDRGALPVDVVAVADDLAQRLAAAPEQPPQAALPLAQRQLPQVLTVLEEQVEDHVRQVAGAPVLEMPLQAAEVAHAALVEHHDLAVEPAAAGRQRAQRGGDLGEPLRPVEPVAGEQARVPAAGARRYPVAVVLDLVDPALPLGRALDQRRQRERHGVRDGRPLLAACLRGGSVGRAGGVRRAGPVVPRLPGGDLVHAAPAGDAAVGAAPRVRLAGARLLVALLDEEPLVVVAAARARRCAPAPSCRAGALPPPGTSARPSRGPRAGRRPAPRCRCPTASPCRRRTRPWGSCPRSRRTPRGGPPRAPRAACSCGSRLGPLGTAQLTSTPSSSSRRS